MWAFRISEGVFGKRCLGVSYTSYVEESVDGWRRLSSVLLDFALYLPPKWRTGTFSWRMEEPGKSREALSCIIRVGPDGIASPPGSWLQGGRPGAMHQHEWQSGK